MGKLIDLKDRRFGRLVVIKRVEDRVQPNGSHVPIWECVCDCGKHVNVSGSDLRTGNTKSCGCTAHDKCRKHGESKTRLYKIWEDIKRRCYNKNDKGYSHYGGRGIIVCEEWYNNYIAFKEWAMQNGYDYNLPRGTCTLDRINVDMNYCPENCRWVDMTIQGNNTTRNRRITYNNETHTITEWARILNINPRTLNGRIVEHGWDIERALTTPVKQQRPRVL